VLGRRDNHYTTETHTKNVAQLLYLYFLNDKIMTKQKFTKLARLEQLFDHVCEIKIPTKTQKKKTPKKKKKKKSSDPRPPGFEPTRSDVAYTACSTSSTAELPDGLYYI
jgi:hypothetical protein